MQSRVARAKRRAAHYQRNKATLLAKQRAYGVKNRSAILKQKAKYNLDNALAIFEKRLWPRYGLTCEKYYRMLAAQNGLCVICKGPEKKVGCLRLAVDHDHTCCPGVQSCGKCVRGLVCSSCNAFMGLAGDRPDLLRLAANYLEGTREI